MSMRPYSSSTTSIISSIEAGSATSVVDRQRLAAGLHDLRRRPRRALLSFSSAMTDARAGLREGLGENAADALAGAGDDDDAVLQRGEHDIVADRRSCRASFGCGMLLPAPRAHPTASTTA